MMKKKQQKTVAEFFAGIGLMRAGLERAGWVTIFANDIDPVKYKLYQNHFKQEDAHFIIDDIHNIDGNSVPSIDLATASFPCTDLSLAGKRAGLAGKHSSAFWGFVNVLKEMGDRKPPLILLENVAGFLTSNNGQDFFDALFALNEEGYAVDAFLIDASHFIPQSRVRLFVVGKLTDEPNLKLKHFLPVTELRPEKLVNFISNHPEIHWNLNTRLPLLPKNKNNLSSIIETIPKSSPIWFSNDRVNYLLNQTFERHLTKILELKDKKTYTYLTAFRRVRNGKSMAEIRFDGIAGCLRTPKGGSARQILLEVGKGTINVRLLTPRECARLMGADDFKIVGTVNEALFGFGDAVCVPVVTWIAENYLNYEISHFSLKQQRQKEHAAAKEFIEWYNSLKVVKANNGPANGSIATALVVLNRLKDTYNLNFSAHVADGGTQIKGASGAAVAAILKSFGEKRPFAKEGGRTNRGGPSEVRSLLKMLNLLNLDNQNAESRNEQLNNMMAFLVERVKDFHNRQKIKLTFNPALSTWHIVHNLLYEAMVEGKAGYVAQHLVGAKLQLRFPSIIVSNESGSTADKQTQRPGDFLIGHTAFHVTVAPMQPVFEKCRYNISQGFKPFLLVPDSKLIGARQIAEQVSEKQIAVDSIESFVSQNINELSNFSKDELVLSFRDLVKLYNKRVDEVETDKSLMIELPSNLQ